MSAARFLEAVCKWSASTIWGVLHGVAVGSGQCEVLRGHRGIADKRSQVQSRERACHA